MKFYCLYKRYCDKQQDTGKYRELPDLSCLNKNLILDFSSNDYLNLSQNLELVEAVREAAKLYGIGSTGSRLLSGNHILFKDLEKQIAIDKGTEAALIFNSGYQANVTILSSLLDKSVLASQAIVFFDRLNHASLYQGVFLSGAELIRYHHNDMEHLETVMLKYKNSSRPKFIVSETLYGMDGDIAPVAHLVMLADRYKALLYLDEAHASGILGKDGYGVSTTIDMSHIKHVIMGTFSKGLGVYGAYIACSQIIKEFLINKCSGFIYSTSLPPMVINAVMKSWKIIKLFGQQRCDLLEQALYLRLQLKYLGFNIGSSDTHIIPIILGSEEATLKAYNDLKNMGILLSAVRPPTVPPSASRLRLALTLKHTRKDIEKLLEGLNKLLVK